MKNFFLKSMLLSFLVFSFAVSAQAAERNLKVQLKAER